MIFAFIYICSVQQTSLSKANYNHKCTQSFNRLKVKGLAQGSCSADLVIVRLVPVTC